MEKSNRLKAGVVEVHVTKNFDADQALAPAAEQEVYVVVRNMVAAGQPAYGPAIVRASNQRVDARAVNVLLTRLVRRGLLEKSTESVRMSDGFELNRVVYKPAGPVP